MMMLLFKREIDKSLYFLIISFIYFYLEYYKFSIPVTIYLNKKCSNETYVEFSISLKYSNIFLNVSNIKLNNK